jgi:hypothetical protein
LPTKLLILYDNIRDWWGHIGADVTPQETEFYSSFSRL